MNMMYLVDQLKPCAQIYLQKNTSAQNECIACELLLCHTSVICKIDRLGVPDDVPSGVRANYLCLLVCI